MTAWEVTITTSDRHGRVGVFSEKVEVEPGSFAHLDTHMRPTPGWRGRFVTLWDVLTGRLDYRVQSDVAWIGEAAGE